MRDWSSDVCSSELKSQDLTGGKWAGGIGGGTRDAITFNSGGGGTFNFTADGGYSLGGVARVLGLDIGAVLDLADSSGLATTLAQPNLTSRSGETASFLAGGEYPSTVSNEIGKETCRARVCRYV